MACFLSSLNDIHHRRRHKYRPISIINLFLHRHEWHRRNSVVVVVVVIIFVVVVVVVLNIFIDVLIIFIVVVY